MEIREVPNHWKGRCFGCSALNAHGLRLRFFLAGDDCFAKVTVPEHLCGLDGVVHGGIVSLMLDETAGWTLVALLGRMGVTLDLGVTYLKTVPTGVELTVTGRIESSDAKRAVVNSHVSLADGTVLAQARSHWRFVSPPSVSKLTKVGSADLREFLSHYPAAYRD